MRSKRIGVTSLMFQGHLASSVMRPFDYSWVIFCTASVDDFLRCKSHKYAVLFYSLVFLFEELNLLVYFSVAQCVSDCCSAELPIVVVV